MCLRSRTVRTVSWLRCQVSGRGAHVLHRWRPDVSFWRKAKSLAGLSMQTIVMNVFFQTYAATVLLLLLAAACCAAMDRLTNACAHRVVWLYLYDNDANSMVLFSSGLGVLIEVWKLTKAFRVKVTSSGLKIETKQLADLEALTDEQRQQVEQLRATKHHDSVAMRHLGYVLYPMVGGYALYSLLYLEHTGWYSFVLSVMVGFIYVFGTHARVCPWVVVWFANQLLMSRLCVDDAAIVHQLQAEKRRPHALAIHGVQELEHLHRRHFRVCGARSNDASGQLLQRWCVQCVPCHHRP